ncbi:Bardet-Biedl syndrome 5 protein [Fasciola gigantica]|uniref:Bardet-Biedl syndrome 5 protein n=1 Tax=Fasciola gigantica TaxID=46835 RepID=A0A504YAM0_FASGI|nr:Bardet-Biedl syndrome 5 protein [Fasciola gigantica]
MTDNFWHDTTVRFDISKKDLALRTGEITIDKLYPVEDTKGNSGDRGTLTVTNLRLIWCTHQYRRLNLSIGYACILNISKQNTKSKLYGLSEALSVLAKNGNTRYEFIFTYLVPGNPRIFVSVTAVFKAYDSSRTYRELKIRHSLLDNNKKLVLLPREHQYDEIDGVWNLTSDQAKFLHSFI